MLACGLFFASEAGAFSWRWSNPAPHGANIVDTALSGSLAVQVGEQGQIFTTTDLDNWIPRDSHTDRHLRGVTFLAGRLVICGERGTILSSEDFAEFRLIDLGTMDWLESVAASADLAVAVGDHGALYTSRDGISWIRMNSGFQTWLRSVAWGPGGFVAVGEDGFIISSKAGDTWRQRNSGVSLHLNRVVWTGESYCVVGDSGHMLTSTDGAEWTFVTCGATNVLYAAAGATSTRLVAGESEVRFQEGNRWVDELNPSKSFGPPAWSYYSALWAGASYWLGGASGLWLQGYRTNASSELLWYEPRPSVHHWLWAVTRTSSCYLAVGDRGTVMASDNGVDWELDLVPTSATNTVFLGVGCSTNHMIAVGNAGAIVHSPNGVVWTAVEPRPTTNDLQGIAAIGGLYLAAGAKGTILTSVDAATWTRQVSPTAGFLSAIAVFPGGLVVVGDGGTILASPDGTNWVTHAVTTTNWFWQVRYLNGALVLVGENGTLRTSLDGVDWKPRISGTTEWLTDVAYVRDTWVAVGTGGTVLTSTNLADWSNVGTLTRKALFGVAASEGQLLAVGVEGIILRSQVIPNLTPVEFLRYGRGSEHNVFLLGGKPDQKFILERSSDLSAWTPSMELEFSDGSGTVLLIEDIAPGLDQEFYRGLLLPSP